MGSKKDKKEKKNEIKKKKKLHLSIDEIREILAEVKKWRVFPTSFVNVDIDDGVFEDGEVPELKNVTITFDGRYKQFQKCSPGQDTAEILRTLEGWGQIRGDWSGNIHVVVNGEYAREVADLLRVKGIHTIAVWF